MIEALPKLLEKSYDDDSLIYVSDTEFYYNKEFDRDLLKDIENHDFQIYNGTYKYNPEWKSPKIFLNGRGKTCGKKIFKVQGFLPYCYIESDKGESKTYLGKSVEKIIFETEPRRVADLRKHRERMGSFVPYEADILFVRRFLLDTYDFFKPKEHVKPRVAIFDVETNFPVNNNLIAFTINEYKKDGFLYHNNNYLDKNKYSLALDAYTKLKDFDVVTNWNVEFDVKTTLQVCLEQINLGLRPLEEGYEISKASYIKKLTTDYNLFGIPTATKMLDALEEYNIIKIEDDIVKWGEVKLETNLTFLLTCLDLRDITKKMYAQEIRGRWSLDNTGVQLCGVGKVEYEGKYPRDLDNETLIEYNTIDTIIPEIIDNFLGGVECHIILAWSLQSLVEDMMITAVVNDIALLRAYHKDGIVLPSRPPYSVRDKEETYKAAEPDARPGVYSNLIAYDLHAAYPSAVLAVNASSETKDPEGQYKAPNGVRFNNNYSTFIKTLQDLLTDRERIKDKLKILPKNSSEWRTCKFIDFALKTQVAAFSHGIFGWSNSRMKDIKVADAITATVRGILDTVKNKSEELGVPWVYVHTDSCYISAPKEKAEELGLILNKAIENHCNTNKYSTIPRLDYKGFYPRAYIHSAARNVLVDENGDWDITGMNMMRSEVPPPLAEIEKELISLKLTGASVDTLLTRLKDMVNELKYKDTRELGIVKPLSKSIKKYGRKGKDGTLVGIPYHINALQRAEKEYGFMVKIGEKFSVIPILIDEWEGVRVRRRKKAYMAYPTDEGLPEMYEIDWDNYLKSNLYGKIKNLFNMTKRELGKELEER